jgi:thiosulfate/3-mercaptopyruvate sulfurtransferase
VNELDERFFILNKEQPVVAFTNTGFKGSVLWLALEIMGYDGRLYSYQNWIANQLTEQRSRDAQE